jgi:hypothetical protein
MRLTFTEVLVSAAIVATVGTLVAGGTDRFLSTPSESVLATVTDKHFEPTHIRPVIGDGVVRFVVEPAEWRIYCGETVLYCDGFREWGRIHEGDRVILQYSKGYWWETLYLTGWSLAAGQAVEKQEVAP